MAQWDRHRSVDRRVPTTDCGDSNASDQEIVLVRGTPPFAGCQAAAGPQEQWAQMMGLMQRMQAKAPTSLAAVINKSELRQNCRSPHAIAKAATSGRRREAVVIPRINIKVAGQRPSRCPLDLRAARQFRRHGRPGDDQTLAGRGSPDGPPRRRPPSVPGLGITVAAARRESGPQSTRASPPKVYAYFATRVR